MREEVNNRLAEISNSQARNRAKRAKGAGKRHEARNRQGEKKQAEFKLHTKQDSSMNIPVKNRLENYNLNGTKYNVAECKREWTNEVDILYKYASIK